MIFAADRIFHIERRGYIAADPFAIFDHQCPIGALGHDLNRHSIEAGNPDTDKPVTQIGDHRFDDVGDARFLAAFAYEPVVGHLPPVAANPQNRLLMGIADAGRRATDNKKERDRPDPLSIDLSRC